jgi:hypothetical protein
MLSSISKAIKLPDYPYAPAIFRKRSGIGGFGLLHRLALVLFRVDCNVG